jgi:hypothetical protein
MTRPRALKATLSALTALKVVLRGLANVTQAGVSGRPSAAHAVWNEPSLSTRR